MCMLHFTLNSHAMEGDNKWKIKLVRIFFLEKEDDPRPLHLDDAYGHFINYSHKTLQNQYNSKTKAAV